MIQAMRFSSRTVGLASAVITVLIWTGFIVIARASASRGLLPLDIALARILGASLSLEAGEEGRGLRVSLQLQSETTAPS